MREKFFGILLTGLEHHTPGPVLCIQTQILLNATARTFGRKGIRVWNHSPQRALREYAAFSVQCMNASPADPEAANDVGMAVPARRDPGASSGRPSAPAPPSGALPVF